MRITKKIAAIFLAVVMAFAMMPMTALADGNVAMIGDNGYSSLTSAISAASTGDVIKMVADDSSVTSTVTLYKNLTLDLNGQTVTMNVTSGMNGAVKLNGYSLTIKDTSVNEDGSMNIASSSGNGAYAFYVSGSGSNLTIESGNVTAVNVAGADYWSSKGIQAVTVSSGATFNMTGGSLTASNANNSGKAAYAVYLSGGTANISGGSIIADDHDTYGWSDDHLVYKSSGTANITGGKFKSPKNLDYTGVINKLPNGYGLAAADADGFRAVTKYVAKIGSTYYATLEAAVEASQEGDTIELVNDVDLSGKYGRSTAAYIFNLRNRTLDLDGHKISMYNHGVGFSGDNMTITNGTFECVPTDSNVKTSYALPIYPETFTRQSSTASDLNTVSDKSTGVVLEDLTLNPGGLNIKGAEVTCKNLDVTGSYYYGVSAEHDSVVNIVSGNYTTTNGGTAVISTSDKTDGTPKLDDNTQFVIKGGNFNTGSATKMFATPNNKHYTVKGGFYHKSDSSVFTVPVAYIAENCAQNMETGEVTQSAANDAQSIEVADTITENFYIDEDFYGEDAKVEITYNHNSNASQTPDFQTETVDLDTLPAVDGGRKISIPQAPAQITEPVEINIIKNNVVVETYETNAYEYCRAILEDSTQPAELKEVAESTLDYAAAAQLYFNYNTGNMATKDVAGDFYNDVNNADLSGVAGFVSRPAGFVSASMVIKSDLEVNLLSTGTFAVSGASLDTTRGGSRFAATATGKNGAYYVLNVTGIEPANMNNTITVNTDQGDVVFTANTIMKALSNSSNAKVATLAKACYLYGVAAENYFA